jgi:sulfotransferase family protein
MIAASPMVAYIHEPFHIDHDRGVCAAEFEQWFTYICKENEDQYYKHLKKTIHFQYNLAAKLKGVKQLRDIIVFWERYVRFKKLRKATARPLIKDPIAIFSAEWLASTFDMDVVVMIRHPAAFCASCKVKNWTFNFFPFLQQPLLLRDHLRDYADEIREFTKNPGPVIAQAALLWRCLHAVILKYREKHPDWIFVRHEDLSQDPIKGFETIYKNLGIPFNDAAADVIQSHSIDARSNSSLEKKDWLKRDSRSNIWTWKDRLAAEEIDYVKHQVQGISGHFYSDEDW